MDRMWTLMGDYLYLTSIGFGIEVVSFVLMPNHFHLIARAPRLNLPDAMEYFLRETSRQINRECGRINRVWGRRYHSSRLESARYFLCAYRYVYRNPVEAGLTDSCLNYPYSTLPSLMGYQPGIIPVVEDVTLFNDPEGILYWLDRNYETGEREAVRKALKKRRFAFEKPRSFPLRRPERVEGKRQLVEEQMKFNLR